VLVFGEMGIIVSVVGMWESRRLCEIPKGARWKERESWVCFSALSMGPGISTTLAYLVVACRFSAVRLKR